jgi:Ca2+-binding EF-hand superfamily protein
MDLEDIDLQGIAIACEWKEEHSILDQQIRLLQNDFIKSRKKEKGAVTKKHNNIVLASLGIMNTSSKEIIKAPKYDKKRGRLSNKQLLQELGELLLNLRTIKSMAEKFSSHPQPSQ